MITIYTLAYNEEFMLPYFMRHYRTMFPDCKIVVYDNYSTDDTVKIAESFGCKVIKYDTGNKLSDKTYLEIKNNCWKDAETDWVLVADVDEHCGITQDDLKRQSSSIISFAGYNMVNHKDDINIESIRHFVRAPSYDKSYLFNKSKIQEINYQPGCHKSYPVGDVTYSNNRYPCRHYKYINPDYMVKRHAMFSARLSDDNIKNGYGGHYLYTEEEIRREFQEAINQSK